jgi:DNA-binding GntR family transcriptional regulator
MSASDQAFRGIYDLILSGEIHPGDRLREIDLSARLNVSRTPVREALRRLAANGLVVSSGRGAVVAVLDQDRVADLYEFRAALEALAARLAASRNARHEIPLASGAELRRINSAIEEAADRADVHAVTTSNLLLHRRIAELAGNEFLTDALGRIWDLIAVSGPPIFSDERWGREVHRHHAEFIEAIENGDPDIAERAARDHVINAAHVYAEIASGDTTPAAQH